MGGSVYIAKIYKSSWKHYQYTSNSLFFMQKKVILFHLLSIFFFSCSAQQKELSLSGNYYTINLDGKKEPFVPLSSLFKSVRPIILETKKDCLIGRITEFQVFNERIFILDARIAKSLFVFDIDGNFTHKIGRLGKGPGEYLQLMDFTLDIENGFIFLLDNGAFIHKYKFDGTYVNSIKQQAPRSSVSFIQFYKGKLYASVKAWEPAPDKCMLFEIDQNNGKVLSSFLPLKYNKGWDEAFDTGHSFFMSRTNSPPRYNQLFMEYIVSIGDTITPYIELKSKNFVTKSDIENILQQADESVPRKLSRYLRERSMIWDMNSFVESNDFIIFRYNSGWNWNDFFTVIFYKAIESVKIVNYLSNDLIYKQDKNGMFVNFRFSDTKGAYSVLVAEEYNLFRASMNNDEIVPDIEKIDKLLKLNEKEESNPVIFFYEFK